jgi:hypothetical protein
MRRIHWKEPTRAKVLAEAARIVATEGRPRSWLTLIQRAQLVLDEHERRPWQTYPINDSNAWFHTRLEEAVEAYKKAQDNTPVLSSPQHAEIPPNTLDLVSAATKAMNEIYSTLVTQSATLTEIISRLNAVENAQREINEKFALITQRGFTAVFMPTYMGLPSNITYDASNTLLASPITPIAPVTPTLPSPPPPTKTYRKPRVVVLNVPSGSTKEGIKTGTQNRWAALDWMQVREDKVPHFNNYDYIVVTKWVSAGWVELAKKLPEVKARIRHAYGNAIKIAEYMKANLVDIEIDTDQK